MTIRLAMSAAVLALASTFAFAQDTTPTQSQDKPAAAADAGTSVSSAATDPGSRRVTPGSKMLDEAYKASGASDEQVQKLKDLDEKMKAARMSRNRDEIRKLREEKEKILTPEQVKAMREFIVNKRRSAFQESSETTGPGETQKQ